MDHKTTLEDLHHQSLSTFEEYIKLKGYQEQAEQEKIHQLKNEWQLAWNKLMESLLILERLEI